VLGNIIDYCIKNADDDRLMKKRISRFNWKASKLVPSLDSPYPDYRFSGYVIDRNDDPLHYWQHVLGCIKGIAPILEEWFPYVPEGGGHAHKIYNNRKYKIRIGSRGGKYILVKGNKVYV
jgi:hypothetical protein